MDKETLKIFETLGHQIAEKAATEAVAKMREFHQDDLKILGERMEMGFAVVNKRIADLSSETAANFATVNQRLTQVETRLEKIETRLENIETRTDRTEHALTILIEELREDRSKVRALEKQVLELTARVQFLESKLQNA